MRPLALILGLLIVLAVVACAPVVILPEPQYDPALAWNYIRTEHFEVHYPRGSESIAREAGAIAEQVHAELSPLLKWSPHARTRIVMTDHIDQISGTATPIPYNTITLNLTPPIGTAFLYNYSHWIRLLITHEYAHILHLDAVAGGNRWLRIAFGRVPFILTPLFTSIPNLWQPTWLIEGLATYEETELGTSDRRDGTLTEMILRMAVLEDRFPALDQAGGTDRWPSGQIPYLFGSNFYEHIVSRYGPEAPASISERYSRVMIPFMVEGNARMILGKRYQPLWQEWRLTLRDRYESQKVKIEADGRSPTHPLTGRGYLILGPRFSPDGSRIAYSEANQDTFPSIRIIHADGSEDRTLSLRNSGYGLSWSPDGKKIAFAQIEAYRNYSFYSDLYRVHVDSGREERLTRGLRARDPDYSPDGRSLVFVRNRLGQSRLAILNLDDGSVESLTDFSDDTQYAHPRWSPDGKSIAVGVWKNGNQDVGLLDLSTRSLRLITRDPGMDIMPSWSSDGKWIYFISERTGVFNIFAYSTTDQSLYRVSNLLGGALTPHPSPDGLTIAYSNYSADGFDLHTMPTRREDWEPVGPVERAQSPMSLPTNPVNEEQAPDFAPARAYSPFPTLLPRFWAPLLGGDEEGLMAGLITGGVDVLGKHRYDLVAFYGVESKRPAYSFSYRNNQFYPTGRLRVSDLAVLHADLLTNPAGQELDYWERRRTVSADLIIPMTRLRWNQQLSVGYRGERIDSVTTIPPAFAPPQEGDLSGARVTWQFDSANRYGYSVSREDGRRLTLSYERMMPSLGSDFSMARTIGGWHEYFTLPYLKHHVLAARLVGGLATGDVLRQRAFQLGSPLFLEELISLDESAYFLRGYPPRRFRGQRMALATIEYRFPVLNIERGIRTWPFFLRRVHGTFFADAGNAWDKNTRLRDFKTGAGAEISLNMRLAYHLTLPLRFGLAYGLDEDGILRGYFAVGNSF